MNNKRIIIVTSVIVLLILAFFIFYLIEVRPVIVGDYTPSIKECDTAYDCDCLQDTCICTFKKYFWENRLSCKRNDIKKEQMRK